VPKFNFYKYAILTSQNVIFAHRLHGLSLIFIFFVESCNSQSELQKKICENLRNLREKILMRLPLQIPLRLKTFPLKTATSNPRHSESTNLVEEKESQYYFHGKPYQLQNANHFVSIKHGKHRTSKSAIQTLKRNLQN
jgi:hypothetical protein